MSRNSGNRHVVKEKKGSVNLKEWVSIGNHADSHGSKTAKRISKKGVEK